MNAREAMQALLDGKTVIDKWGNKFKVSEQGALMTNRIDGTWRKTISIFNDGLQIFEEYPLTFEEALQAMLDGKIVQADYRGAGTPSGCIYRLNNGVIKSKCSRWDWSPDTICDYEQLRKWKVVE